MRLVHVLKYRFSGGQSNYLQQKMKSFQPLNQQYLYTTLLDLYKMREYMPFNSPTFANFVTTLQTFYRKQRIIDKHTLKIYQMMQKMQMLTDSGRKIFQNNICSYLLDQKVQQSIRNQKLQKLLWWLHRQFPFQSRRFEEVASNYTVKLYDIFEFMNTVDKVPTWEPFIRVAYMLKVLGHDMECRQDMFNLQIIQKISRHYFIYLLGIFNPSEYKSLAQKMKIHTSLLQFLCDHYIMGDDIDYDKYLQRIEIIDNISSNEQVNKTMDSISWSDLASGWKLAALSYRQGQMIETHEYKFTEMFWRKLQTSDIPIQEITIMLKLMIENPTMFFDKRQSIILRMVESLYEKNTEEIQFFSPKGYLQLLKMPEFLPMDGNSVKKLSTFLHQKIPSLLNWQQGHAQEIKQYLQKKQFQGKQRIMEFLSKKIRARIQ